MAPNQDKRDEVNEYHLPIYKGKPHEDYNLWRFRLKAALQAKQYWAPLQTANCTEEIKSKATGILVTALGDTALRSCMSAYPNTMQMIEKLDDCYASKRAASRIALLTSVFSKRFDKQKNMGKYIDEFNQAFSQLESIGADATIPDSLKGPILLASFGTTSELEPCIAALRMKDKIPKWEELTADLVLESQRIRATSRKNGDVSTNSRKTGRGDDSSHRRTGKPSFLANQAHGTTGPCKFCGGPGHKAPDCWWNPANPRNKLPDEDKKAIMNALQHKVTPDYKGNGSQCHFGNYVVTTSTSTNQADNHTARKAEWTRPQKPLSSACLDSGASRTFFQNTNEAIQGTYKKGSNTNVQLAAGKSGATCMGEGTIQIGPLILKEAVHVKSLNDTLISVPQICDIGKLVVFTKNEAVILNTSKFKADASLIDAVVPRDAETGLYFFKKADVQSEKASKVVNISLLHRRLIHSNENVIRKSTKQARSSTSTTPLKIKGKMRSCHPCALGKSTKKPFKSTFKSTNTPGEIIHSDLDGPLPSGTYGSKYLCTFIDQATRHMTIATFRNKSDAAQATKMYVKSEIAKHFPRGVQRFHTDGGGEFEFADLESFEHTITTPSTPQHNPFAERANRTIFDPVRTLLEESGLSRKYWELAATHVAYVKNRLYCKVLKKSPFEALTKSQPTLHHIRVFGCAAFVYDEDPKSKVHSRANPAIYLGSNDDGIFTCEIISTRKIVESRHVSFDESSFPALEIEESSSSEDESMEAFNPDTSSEHSSSESDTEYAIIRTDATSARTPVITPSAPRPVRNRQPTNRYTPSGNLSKCFANGIIDIPITTSDTPSIKDALEKATETEKQLWLESINTEFRELEKSKTWKRINRSDYKGKRPLPTHIVLRIKRDAYGNPIRFKSRIVVGGNFQVRGVDYEEVYAPVVDFALVRLFVAMSINFNWNSKHVDIRAAFLNSTMDREVHVTHPVNLPKGMRNSDVYLLLKALYGLHQAPVLWYRKLINSLKEIGFKLLHLEGAVLILRTNKNGNESTIVVLIYVDDLIFFSNEEDMLEKIVKHFLEKFDGTDLGPVRWYLGVSIEYFSDYVKLSQTAYIDELAKEYEVLDCNPVHTPMAANFYCEAESNKNMDIISQSKYRRIIGSLLFAATRTRPDVSLAVGVLAQYVSRPTKFLLRAAVRVLKYLYSTRTHGIVFKKSANPSALLQASSDADHAGDQSDRKSRSGFVATIDGSTIHYSSKKQASTAINTAESEYIAMSDTCKEILWLRAILQEMNFKQPGPTELKVDNTASQYWATSEAPPRRAKHLDVRYHFIREHVTESKSIMPLDVPSHENTSDGFTKPLARIKFNKFRHDIGVRANNID